MAFVLVTYILNLPLISFISNHQLYPINHLFFYFQFLFYKLIFLVLISYLTTQFVHFPNDLVVKILRCCYMQFIMALKFVRLVNLYFQGFQFHQAAFLFGSKFHQILALEGVDFLWCVG